MSDQITKESSERSFKLLSGRLDLARTEAVRLVICGGSALIATGLRSRTTHDADICSMTIISHQLGKNNRHCTPAD